MVEKGENSPGQTGLQPSTASKSPSSAANAEVSQSVRNSSDSNMCFAMRPTASGFAEKSSWGALVPMKANSYKLKMRPGFSVRKYAMLFTPEIPDNSKISHKVTREARD